LQLIVIFIRKIHNINNYIHSLNIPGTRWIWWMSHAMNTILICIKTSWRIKVCKPFKFLHILITSFIVFLASNISNIKFMWDNIELTYLFYTCTISKKCFITYLFLLTNLTIRIICSLVGFITSFITKQTIFYFIFDVFFNFIFHNSF
jgi:hypothetical protein